MDQKRSRYFTNEQPHNGQCGKCRENIKPHRHCQREKRDAWQCAPSGKGLRKEFSQPFRSLAKRGRQKTVSEHQRYAIRDQVNLFHFFPLAPAAIVSGLAITRKPYPRAVWLARRRHISRFIYLMRRRQMSHSFLQHLFPTGMKTQRAKNVRRGRPKARRRTLPRRKRLRPGRPRRPPRSRRPGSCRVWRSC